MGAHINQTGGDNAANIERIRIHERNVFSARHDHSPEVIGGIHERDVVVCTHRRQGRGSQSDDRSGLRNRTSRRSKPYGASTNGRHSRPEIYRPGGIDKCAPVIRVEGEIGDCDIDGVVAARGADAARRVSRIKV